MENQLDLAMLANSSTQSMIRSSPLFNSHSNDEGAVIVVLFVVQR
jgi:hypothetical protein